MNTDPENEGCPCSAFDPDDPDPRVVHAIVHEKVETMSEIIMFSREGFPPDMTLNLPDDHRHVLYSADEFRRRMKVQQRRLIDGE